MSDAIKNMQPGSPFSSAVNSSATDGRWRFIKELAKALDYAALKLEPSKAACH